tara:strand:- start:1414 stop:2499 length:1086 start_codon:yes stop_codon:yes gene_type:complete
MNSQSHQEWKYTNSSVFSDINFQNLSIEEKQLNDNLIEVTDNQIIFSSNSDNLSMNTSQDIISRIFNKEFKVGLSNYALSQNEYCTDENNSIFISVSKSSLPERVKININNTNKSNISIKIYLYLSKGSKLEILDESIFKGNTSLQIYSLIEDGAQLEFYRFNKFSPLQTNSSFHFLRLKEGSIFKDYNFNNGSKQNRAETIVNLDAKNSHFLGSGTIISKSTHSDNVVEINHNNKSATSDCFFKTVSQGESNVIFDGKIYVGENCSDTLSNQISKGLLMDEKARINLMPKLEINNDDVVCSHGAASGKPDEETIFYLTSRGVSEEEAKKIYIQGFLGEFVEKIENAQMKVKAKQFISLNS